MPAIVVAAVVLILSAAATPARTQMAKARLSALWNYSVLVADMATTQAREGLGSATTKERYGQEFCRFIARTVQECMLVQERNTMEQGGFSSAASIRSVRSGRADATPVLEERYV